MNAEELTKTFSKILMTLGVITVVVIACLITIDAKKEYKIDNLNINFVIHTLQKKKVCSNIAA